MSNSFPFSSRPVTPETIKSIWCGFALPNLCQLHFLFHSFFQPQTSLYLLVPFIHCSWSNWSLISRDLYFPFQDKHDIWSCGFLGHPTFHIYPLGWYRYCFASPLCILYRNLCHAAEVNISRFCKCSLMGSFPVLG